MSKLKICPILVLSCMLVGLNLPAQTNGTPFRFTITPTNNAVMILETTNILTALISNLSSTNIEYITNSDNTVTTNTTITNLYTNVTVQAAYTFSTNVTTNMLDNGRAPDKTAADSIYSANLFVPPDAPGTNIIVNFTFIGEDLTATNDQGQTVTVPVTNTASRSYKLVSRPPNDKFTNAIKFPAIGGTLVGSNNYASMQPGEPQHAKVPTVDASVWWTWSSPVATNVLVDTAGCSFSPALAVYTGDTLNKLVEVASATNDVANNLKAHVNFNALAGVTYRIAVAGQDTNGVGDVRLRVQPGGQPDTHAPLVSILSPDKQTLITSSNLYISGLAKEPFNLDSGISNVFLKINNLPATNAVGSDNWSQNLLLPPGTNVVIAYAMDYAGNIGPSDSIVVRFINPTNDNFSDAILLTGVGNTVSAINGRATLEPGEPLHSGNVGGHSIWYKWRAPANGTLSLSTSGSDFDTLLDVYVGTNITNMVTIQSNDDAADGLKWSYVTQDVASNQLYYISVDGYGGASGNITLQYAFTTPTPGQYYYLTVNASPGGTVSPPSGLYPELSRVTLTATPQEHFEFVSWEGSLPGTQNPYTITMTSDTALTARFRVQTTPGTTNVTEDFETGDFTKMAWTSTNAIPWFVQTNVVSGGTYAARSGDINDSQQSTLSLAATTIAGVASFDVKVSSEQSWDFLEFYVNTNLIQRWSGEVGWTNFIFNVPAGSNSLTWRYVKDKSFSAGLDAAFIDNVFIPLATSTNSTASTMQIHATLEGNALITVQCQPNRTYVLEASTDLVVWQTIASKSSSTGILQFLDTEAISYLVRFYRVVPQ